MIFLSTPFWVKILHFDIFLKNSFEDSMNFYRFEQGS